MIAPRPGTNKRKVYDHLMEHGIEATQRFAPSVKVQPSTVIRWAKEWDYGRDSNDNSQADNQTRKANRARATNGEHGEGTTALSDTRSSKKGTGVTVKWEPETRAQLLNKGEEVSEVRFEDGRVRFITNDQLEM